MNITLGTDSLSTIWYDCVTVWMQWLVWLVSPGIMNRFVLALTLVTLLCYFGLFVSKFGQAEALTE